MLNRCLVGLSYPAPVYSRTKPVTGGGGWEGSGVGEYTFTINGPLIQTSFFTNSQLKDSE